MSRSIRWISTLCIVFSIVIGLGVATAQESGRQPITVDNASQVVELAVLEGHTDDVLSITFAADPPFVVSGGADNSVRLWDTETGEEPSILGRTTDPVTALSWMPDATTLVSRSGRGSSTRIITWNIQTQEKINSISGSKGGRTWESFALSPDGQTFAASVCGGQVSMSNDGISCTQNFIEIDEMATGNQRQISSGYFTDTVTQMAYSPDGTLLVAGSKSGSALLFDIENGLEKTNLLAADSWVDDVAFSSDGTLLAIVAEGAIHLFDVETKEETRILGGTDYIVSAAFSPDGTVLASGSSEDGFSVQLWNVETGDELVQLPGHGESVIAVAFSPDGTLIASGSRDDTVRLWGIQGQE